MSIMYGDRKVSYPPDPSSSTFQTFGSFANFGASFSSNLSATKSKTTSFFPDIPPIDDTFIVRVTSSGYSKGSNASKYIWMVPFRSCVIKSSIPGASPATEIFDFNEHLSYSPYTMKKSLSYFSNFISLRSGFYNTSYTNGPSSKGSIVSAPHIKIFMLSHYPFEPPVVSACYQNS